MSEHQINQEEERVCRQNQAENAKYWKNKRFYIDFSRLWALSLIMLIYMNSEIFYGLILKHRGVLTFVAYCILCDVIIT